MNLEELAKQIQTRYFKRIFYPLVDKFSKLPKQELIELVTECERHEAAMLRGVSHAVSLPPGSVNPFNRFTISAIGVAALAVLEIEHGWKPQTQTALAE